MKKIKLQLLNANKVFVTEFVVFKLFVKLKLLVEKCVIIYYQLQNQAFTQYMCHNEILNVLYLLSVFIGIDAHIVRELYNNKAH